VTSKPPRRKFDSHIQRVYDRNFIFFGSSSHCEFEINVDVRVVVHGFLVAFIAGGLADALPRMFKEQTLAQNITQLANNLPKVTSLAAAL